MITEHRKLTQAELVAELRGRFGDDLNCWAFQCPSCMDITTVRDFEDALAQHPREGAVALALIGKECIGRLLGALEHSETAYQGRGCSYAAYGLIHGPWEIVMPDGDSTFSFPAAPAPTEAMPPEAVR